MTNLEAADIVYNNSRDVYNTFLLTCYHFIIISAPLLAFDYDIPNFSRESQKDL